MTDTINITERAIGVNFLETGEAHISLWAPFAKAATFGITNTGCQLPMTQKGCGYWHILTDELKPGDLYSFQVDGKMKLPDPASLSQPEGVHGPSQAIDLNDFLWTDQHWKNPPLQEYIFYELHTGTFSPSGTFQGIEEKISHLKELGITAIELMPVAQFPGTRNWGYDGVFPYAVHHSYGGARGLQQLVNTCHHHGIAVVLDVVYNHLGPEGNYLQEFGPYFTEKYKTPWGKAMNFDDAGCDGVRHYFIENILMWFRDFHIDALRLDAVHAIKDFSAIHILREIRDHLDDFIRQSWSMHYLIVESDLNDPRYIRSTEKDGYGMDAQWIDEFHHALRVTSGEPKTGYLSDFTGIRHLAKSYEDAYVYDGMYSSHRQKRFGLKADDAEGRQFVAFSQNHDQIGNRLLGERSGQLVSFEMQKLMAGATLVSPYLPLLFMGEEYGETNPFLYFVSHSDDKLIEDIREGRKKEFAAFHTNGNAPDPQDEKTFLRSQLQWHLLQSTPHSVLFAYYRELIALRKRHPVLCHLDRRQLEADYHEASNVLKLHRWHNDQHVMCVMNFSRELQQVELNTIAYSWLRIFDSADPVWNGPGVSQNMFRGKIPFFIQPESIIIFEGVYV